MKQQRFNEQFASIYELAVNLSKQVDADVLLVMLDGPTDWQELSKRAGREKILAAADTEEALVGAKEAGLETIVLGMHEAPVFEKLTQALLESVADEILEPNSEVVAVYSGFEADVMDSISFIRLDEHLGRLTARDLRQIETSVPLETLKVVVDLAVIHKTVMVVVVKDG